MLRINTLSWIAFVKSLSAKLHLIINKNNNFFDT